MVVRLFQPLGPGFHEESQAGLIARVDRTVHLCVASRIVHRASSARKEYVYCTQYMFGGKHGRVAGGEGCYTTGRGVYETGVGEKKNTKNFREARRHEDTSFSEANGRHPLAKNWNPSDGAWHPLYA